MNIVLFHKKELRNNLVELSDRRFEHIKKIIKPKIGDFLKVGEINGKMGKGEVINISKFSVSLKINLTTKPPEKLKITLIIALPRPKVLKRMLQRLTALGVFEFIIINSWRVDKSYFGNTLLSKANLEKEMLLGLEQAVDTILPKISIENLFTPFLKNKIPDLLKSKQIFVAHPNTSKSTSLEKHKDAVIIIGPDGGFIKREIEGFLEAGIRIFSLGERILHTETAAILAISKFSVVL